jgi:hypothetical protein
MVATYFVQTRGQDDRRLKPTQRLERTQHLDTTREEYTLRRGSQRVGHPLDCVDRVHPEAIVAIAVIAKSPKMGQSWCAPHRLLHCARRSPR